MADVNLSVAVSSDGVSKAVTELNNLQSTGVATGRTLVKLSEANKAVAVSLSQLSSLVGKSGVSFKDAGQGVKSLKNGMKELRDEYTRLSQLSIGANPAQRLANNLGGGSLAAGRTAAVSLRQQQEAFSANPIRDLMAVERQEQELLSARTQKLSAMASVARATWEASLAGMTPVMRAQAELTRATEEYAVAEKAVAESKKMVLNSDGIFRNETQQTKAQSQALDQLAVATRGVTSAEKQLASASDATASATERQNQQLAANRAQLRQNLQAREAANVALARAKEDSQSYGSSLSVITRAEINLTRATQDLARAEAARKATGISSSNRGRTTALNNEAQAIARVTAAQREMDQAHANEKNGDSNAFQSSYSYFIIAGLAQQAAQGLRDFATASIGASATFQRSFADVDRTFDGTADQLASLKQKLFALSTATPISFTDLSQIAALGNQLGIAAENIQSFTTTISQYSAISGQSAEDSATAFGKISNLTGLAASQYSNLGSSIEYVARTTVATEASISRTAQEITALASGAGFSAQAIVGLSGALSSLSIPPERARGALSLYFGALNGAVAEGGPKLQAFADLTGKTTAEITKLVTTNKGADIFTSFISGLSELNTVAKTTALDTLGLSTIRVDQTMRALSQNVPLVTQSLAGADKAFKENTELGRQYATIQDTVASKLIEFQNLIQNAAVALGDDLGGALLAVIGAIAFVVTGFTDIIKSPIGPWIVGVAGVLGTLVFVISSVVGVLALTKASLVVTQFAFKGLADGIGATSPAFVRFIAGMFRINTSMAENTTATGAAAASNVVFSSTVKQTAVSARIGAVSNDALAVSEKGVAIGGAAATAGLRTMKVALASTGIGLALVLIGSLAAALESTAKAATLTSDDVSGLGDAIKADTAVYNETGQAIQTYSVKLPKVTEDQKKAAAASKAWATVLGVDLTDGAEKAGKAVEKVAAGKNVVEAFRTALGDNAEVKKLASDSGFQKQWSSVGLEMTDLIGLGLKSGGSEKKLTKGVLGLIGGVKKTVDMKEIGGLLTPVTSYSKDGKDITDFYGKLMTLIPAVASEGKVMQDTANKTSFMGSATDDAARAAAGASDGFIGATESLSAYQDAIQSGLSKFTDFKEILKGVEDAQKNANKRKGDDATDTSLINASAFGRDLATANNNAVKFFNDIQTLAKNGSTSFATQLAELGPDAQTVLSDALKLSPEAQQSMEVNARFAAFLASDAFKKALDESMQTSNEAYGRIFKETGNLEDVKSYMRAQANGGAAAWEQAWDAAHPTALLGVDLKDLTPEDIKIFQDQASGQLTVTAKVIPVIGDVGGIPGSVDVKEIGDTKSGRKITVPAALDGTALNQSLALWNKMSNATPKEIEAILNTGSFSPEVDRWRAEHGDIKIYATLVPTNSVAGIFPNSGATIIPGKGRYARGGEVETPHFASGGQWGQFRGPGTGTSDSILARVSAGEYINTNQATSFWGPDFFDSLNREMLPTSFMNMLGAAAVSGNHGPTHVANVKVIQNNPLTRDPLKQLRQDSEMVSNGIWG